MNDKYDKIEINISMEVKLFMSGGFKLGKILNLPN